MLFYVPIPYQSFNDVMRSPTTDKMFDKKGC